MYVKTDFDLLFKSSRRTIFITVCVCVCLYFLAYEDIGGF